MFGKKKVKEYPEWDMEVMVDVLGKPKRVVVKGVNTYSTGGGLICWDKNGDVSAFFDAYLYFKRIGKVRWVKK